MAPIDVCKSIEKQLTRPAARLCYCSEIRAVPGTHRSRLRLTVIRHTCCGTNQSLRLNCFTCRRFSVDWRFGRSRQIKSTGLTWHLRRRWSKRSSNSSRSIYANPVLVCRCRWFHSCVSNSGMGLGQALEEIDRVEDADEQYVKAIEIGGPQQLVDLVLDRRTAIAQKTMRDRGDFRPDVMMYITGALKKFANRSIKDVQAIGVEIAILGQNGLDINDPDQKYSLRSLPGKYSGLHLYSIMYTAFKQFALHKDVGIDFSKEYEATIATHG